MHGTAGSGGTSAASSQVNSCSRSPVASASSATAALRASSAPAPVLLRPVRPLPGQRPPEHQREVRLQVPDRHVRPRAPPGPRQVHHPLPAVDAPGPAGR